MDPYDVIEFMWQRLNRHEAVCLLNYLVDITSIFEYLKTSEKKLEPKQFPRALKSSFDTICKLLRRKPWEERKKIIEVLFANAKHDRPDLRNDTVLTLQVERVLVAASNAVAAMDGSQSARFVRRVHRLLSAHAHALWALYASAPASSPASPSPAPSPTPAPAHRPAPRSHARPRQQRRLQMQQGRAAARS